MGENWMGNYRQIVKITMNKAKWSLGRGMVEMCATFYIYLTNHTETPIFLSFVIPACT